MNDLDYRAYVEEHLAPRVEARIVELSVLAGKHFGSGARIAVESCDVSYDVRGVAAGWARYRGLDSGGRVRVSMAFNARILYHNVEEFIEQTVAHEVAHVIDFALRGESAHDKRWKRIMRALGARPERLHSFEAGVKKTRKVKRYAYHCACRDIELSSIRHNRVVKGEQIYRCKLCGCDLSRGKRSALDKRLDRLVAA